MENRNYSKEIRKYVIKCYALLKSYLKTNDSSRILDMLKESFNSQYDMNDNNMVVITANKFITIDDIKRIKPMVTFSLIQMYTDYYRFLKFQDTREGTNDTYFLNFDSFEEVLWLYNQEDVSHDFYDALYEYKNSSAYDKILLEKNLDDLDRCNLLKINPFYEFEKNRYNIEINLNLIDKQISKWQKAFPNNTSRSYKETAVFLVDLYKINREEARRIINQMISRIGNINVSNYSPDVDTYIDYEGYFIDELILESIVKDYYELNKDNLVKKYGDKHGI